MNIANANAAQSGLAIALATFCSAISSILYRRIKARLNFTQIYGVAFIILMVLLDAETRRYKQSVDFA